MGFFTDLLGIDGTRSLLRRIFGTGTPQQSNMSHDYYDGIDNPYDDTASGYHIPYNDPADDYDYGHSDEFFEDYEPSDYDDYDDY
jgi:hypothetical protein